MPRRSFHGRWDKVFTCSQRLQYSPVCQILTPDNTWNIQTLTPTIYFQEHFACFDWLIQFKLWVWYFDSWPNKLHKGSKITQQSTSPDFYLVRAQSVRCDKAGRDLTLQEAYPRLVLIFSNLVQPIFKLWAQHRLSIQQQQCYLVGSAV